MHPAPKTPDGIVADAPPDNWVDRFAPPAWRPWLRLSRADRPIGTWLLLIPCFWGIGLAMIADAPRGFDLWIALACTIGAFVMRGAGCTWNDITDREFDAAVARTRSRPIPSGQVSVRGACLWLAAQLLIGGAILMTLGPAAMALGVGSLALVAIYPFAKRFTWWPQVFLGLAFNWGVLLAYAAHLGRVDAAPVLAWAAGIAWTIFYDTIYAHQDAEDDALIGVKSTARLFGDDSPRWLAGFGALAVAILAAAVLASGAGGAALAIGLAAPLALGAHLTGQWRRFDPRDGLGCLAIFKSNRDAGLWAALFLAAAGFA